ncbi:MAG: hypothetical protein V4750_04215 [Pseudomonadota bacterium]
MRITPKSEAEVAAAGLLPPGDYNFTVIEAVDRVSQNGNEMIALTLAVETPSGSTRKVNAFLMEKMAHVLRHFCYGTGLAAKYEDGSLVASDCKGMTGTVMLKIEEQEGYKPKNAVKDFVVDPAVKPAPKPKTAAPAAPSDEDVPF